MNSISANKKTISDLVRMSANNVVAEAGQVMISDVAIEKFAAIREPRREHWLEIYPWINRIADTDALLDIIFAFNSISFCYWGDPKWSASFGGKLMDGSKLLLMCLREMLHKDKRLLRPINIAQLSYKEFLEALKGASNLLYVKERYSTLTSLGEIVCEKYSGSYLEMIDKTDGTAQGVLEQLVTDIPQLHDVSTYKKDKVYYFKRAQLLVSDISYCLDRGGFAGLKNTDTLTVCADYKLPQMLRMFGVLVYQKPLAQKIDAKEEIEEGSPEEIEIRSATIVAVDRIVEAYRQLGQNITSMDVNDDLWVMSQSISNRTSPYHRTRTTNY